MFKNEILPWDTPSSCEEFELFLEYSIWQYIAGVYLGSTYLFKIKRLLFDFDKLIFMIEKQQV